MTALLRAESNKYWREVKKLILGGADQSVADDQVLTYLHYAAIAPLIVHTTRTEGSRRRFCIRTSMCGLGVFRRKGFAIVKTPSTQLIY